MKRVLLALSIGSALSCGGDRPAKEYGAELFADRGLSPSSRNFYSCATCHSTTPEPPAGRIDSGYTMHDVVGRPSWWGGQEVRLLDAVNFCFVQFMRAGLEQRLVEDEERSKALYEYLLSLSPSETAPARPLTIVLDIEDTIPRGDAARGAVVYDGACRVCHGALHSGEGQIAGEAVVLPEYFSTYPSQFPDSTVAEVVIEKIRHGRFFEIGGVMPLFSTEALSDADLGALLAHLGI